MAFLPTLIPGSRRCDRYSKCPSVASLRMGVEPYKTQFEANVAQLPPVNGVGQIELHAMSSRGTVRSNYNAVIENKPGQKASIRIYHALLKKHKSITPAAAKEGLEIYAEIAVEAKLKPGSHPNIDLLNTVIEEDLFLIGKVDGSYFIAWSMNEG